MSTYEIVSIVRPDLDEDALNAAIERIHQRITEHGGSVKSTERWGKRRIAYPIQNHRDGFYVLTVFDLDSGRVAPLRQTLRLHEALLRFTVATHRAAPAPAAAAGAAPQAPGAAAATPAAASAGAASQAGEARTPNPSTGAGNV